MTVSARNVSWLPEPSVDAVRAVLKQIAPEFAWHPIDLKLGPPQSDPQWFGATLRLGDAALLKFSWSEAATARLIYQADVLAALAALGLAVPEIIAFSSSPAILVLNFVPGQPAPWGDKAEALPASARSRVGEEIGGELARLHSREVADRLRALGILRGPFIPTTLERLRTDFAGSLDPHRRDIVLRWCDCAESILAEPSEEVCLHGDLHAFNIVFEPKGLRLLRFVDFESAALADYHIDFRYMPAQGPLDLFRSVVATYESVTGRVVSHDRVIAWHVRTMLGDAHWRTAAGIPIPGSSSVAHVVDQISERITTLGLDDRWASATKSESSRAE